MHAYDPRETQQQESRAITNRRGNKSAKQRRNAPGKCVFRYQVPKHITLNDVIMITGIVGIQTKKINGIRDILAKN